MSSEKNVRTWKENEAPLIRWIGAVVFAVVSGLVLTFVISMIISFIPFFDDGMYLAPFKDFFETVLPFAGMFLGSVMGLRWIARTSMRSFLFGRDRKPDIKTALTAGALMFVGILAGSVPFWKNYSLANRSIPLIALNLLFCLLFVWIQTTTEEIFFRGFFLRPPYKNEIPSLPRGLLFAFISSLLFMSVHLSNPEVRSIPFGIDFICGAASYFVGAFGMYICNLLIGGMEAGLVFHFINNFYCFFLVRARISAVESPTIFIDNSDAATGVMTLVQELLMFILPIIYLIRVRRRHMTE